MGSVDHGSRIGSEANIKVGFPGAGEGLGGVLDPVQPRLWPGAVEDGVQPVVGAELERLGVLAPGELDGCDSGAALNLNAAAFEVLKGEQVEADVVLLEERYERFLKAG